MQRKGMILLTAVLLVASAWIWARDLQVQETWSRVERRDLVLGIEVEGELRAVDSVMIGPPQIKNMWNYKISFLTPEGAEVQAGQPVLGFDTSALQQELQEKIAERDSAEKELEKRTTDLEIERRQLELQLAEAQGRKRRAELKISVPEEVIDRNELEEARIDHQLAERELEYLIRRQGHLRTQTTAELAALVEKHQRATARVIEIEQQIAQMRISAPRAGTVIYVTQRRNDKLKVGDQVWRAASVLEIPDLRRMRAQGEIAEADAGRVAVGQPVSLRLDAYLDHEYRGTIHELRQAVQSKSAFNPRKVVKVEIELDETDAERMRPGMRFRGMIESERISKALTVPIASAQPHQSGTSVFVRQLLGRRQVFPVFGRRNDEYFEVLSGLKEGDQVLRFDSPVEDGAS